METDLGSMLRMLKLIGKRGYYGRFLGVYWLTLLYIARDAVLLNWHLVASWRWSSKHRDSSALYPKDIPELILLLPVLREQQHLPRALQALGALSYPGRKRILVVTTEREIAENQGESRGTTIEVVETFLAALAGDEAVSYEHLHFPHLVGNKASQLNYALQAISQDQAMLSSTYIGVYDADSRPVSDTLLRLLCVLAQEEKNNRPWPIALQQPTLFLGNFWNVSWYLQLEALFQTRWVFGHEIRTLRASTRRLAHYLAPYAYCVGHGMFLRADFLQSTGGFPEPSEDVPLGYRLTFLGIPIHPLPVYDVCEVAPRVSTLVRQSGFWCSNALLMWREYQRVRALGLPTTKIRTLTLLMKGLGDFFSWMHYPLHLLALCALLFRQASLGYVLLSALACYLDTGLGIALMLFQFPACSSLACGRAMSVPVRTKIWLTICAPLRPLVRGLAPLLACWYVLQIVFLKRINVLPKTEKEMRAQREPSLIDRSEEERHAYPS